MRSGDGLPQQEVYVGIILGLQSNRPVPRYFAGKIRERFDLATEIKASQSDIQEAMTKTQELIVEAEVTLDELEVNRVKCVGALLELHEIEAHPLANV